MPVPFRLQTSPGSDPQSVRFRLAIADTGADAVSFCAPAWLEPGDGQRLELNVMCAPATVTWREQHHIDLIEHTYAAAGPFTARLRWGDDEAQALITLPAAEEAHPTPEVNAHLDLQPATDKPLSLTVDLQVNGLAPDRQIRLDGDVGQVHLLRGSEGADHQFSGTMTYAKPGAYTILLQLLDAEGYWLANLSETPVTIQAPEYKALTSIDVEQPAESPVAPPAEASLAAATPWLPFRYARPAWSGARTYTTPGGANVSRRLLTGTYLAITAETSVGGHVWYKTAGNDWIAASAVVMVQPSTLRGVELGQTPPPPPPPPPGERRGIVTADVLNVRARPGVSPDNPPIDRLQKGAEVVIFEQRIIAGDTWYRIGPDRWVHGGWVRVLEAASTPPPPPPPSRRGIVTAASLNVRARPGVAADNPPVGSLSRGTEIDIFEETTVADAVWYRIGALGWVHSGWVRLLPSNSATTVAGATAAGVVALPVGWVVASSLQVRAQPGVSNSNPPIDAIAHNQRVAILETTSVGGGPWHRIGDNRWVDGKWIAAARFRARPANISAAERWVAVDLSEQTVVAYEGDRPVYAAMCATGAYGTPTVQGIFRTWRRLTSGKMSGGSPQGGYYYLEGVTWTCYFYRGYALHTAYWHDAFGRPRSHGCVNLSPYDAWWIFQWSAPGGAASPTVYVYP